MMVPTRHTTFGWDHIGSLSVCTSCWWLRGNRLPPMIKNIRFVATFFQGEKVSIHTPLEKKPLAPVNVFIPFEVGDLSPETHICKSAFLGPLSCQSPAYFEGDLPPEFLHLSRNMAPRLTSRVFLGWKNTNLDSPTPTHPLFLLLCKREWIR